MCMSSLLFMVPGGAVSAESGLHDCWSCCQLRSWGPGLKCRHHINQCQFKREDYFNLGVSFYMSQYTAHYLISWKVLLRPPFLLCSFVIARPSGMQQITKWNNLSIPKQMGMGFGDFIKWKHASHSLQHSSPLSLWSSGWGGGGYSTETPVSVGPGKGRHLLCPSLWDLSVRALSALRRKPNEVFVKLPSVNLT